MKDEAGTPLFSVLIATYQRREVLAGTLPSVCAQEFPAEQYEVVVVVDGSTDGTVEMLAGLKTGHAFRVIAQGNSGPAAARQTALRAARGKYVLFTDDDIRLTPGVLAHHLAVHEKNEKPVMVRGSIFVAPESPVTLATDATRQWYEKHAETFDPEKNGAQLPEDFLIFANTSVARAEIEACGGVDVSVPFPQEGFELLYRLLKRGVPLRSAKDAVVYEVYSKPTRKMITSDARGLGRAEWLLCRKHPEYRGRSMFAGLGEGSATKRRLRRLLLTVPLLTSPLLDPAIALADRLRGFAPLRRMGIRALGLRYRTELFRSAIKAAGSWKELERVFGARLPVLMYHHIGPRNANTYYELTIEPEEFRRQIEYFAREGYTAITAADWVAWHARGTPLPEKPLLLTFDDAYADTFEFALPILAERGWGAAVFVVSSLAGGMDAWNECGESRSVLRLATAEQLRTWAARGIEMGGHTRTHADLRRLDKAALEDEVKGGKAELGAMLNAVPELFAYPYGHHDAASEAVVRENFAAAFSVMSGMNTLLTDVHLLRRTMVDPRNSLRQLGQMLKDGEPRPPSYYGRLRRKLWLRSLRQG